MSGKGAGENRRKDKKGQPTLHPEPCTLHPANELHWK